MDIQERQIRYILAYKNHRGGLAVEFTENLVLLLLYVGGLSFVFGIGAYVSDYLLPKLLKRD